MMPKLQHDFRADVPVWRQFGPNDVRRVGVPCMIGVTIDIDELVKKLGEKALKSKGKRATAFHGALILEVREI
jgi:hypothetical protein